MEEDLKQQLLDAFDDNATATHFVRGVELPTGAKEVIVTSGIGLQGQKEYIEKAYNSKLQLNANPAVKIISWMFA